MRVRNQSIFILVLTLALLSSCVYHKKTLLLKDEANIVQDTFGLADLDSSEYILQEGDLLSIKLSSPDQQSILQFNLNKTEGNVISPTPISSYQVDKSGNITVPLIGDLFVQGLTVAEVKGLLKSKLSQYFKYLTVTVQLVSFRVTFLGEVRNPATFTIATDRTNFFEALSRVGGTTEFANTKKVKIVRKRENTAEIIRIDIGSVKFLESESYFLRPNDVVYVPPLRSKVNRNNWQLLTTVSSLASLLIVLVTRIGN